MRFSLAVLMFSFVWILAVPTAVSAQEGCNWCHTGEFDEHANLTNGIVGNFDEAHPYWAYDCMYMEEHGVHLWMCYGGYAFEAFDGLVSENRLTRNDAESLLVSYPEHIILDPSERYVQVLDCERNLVIAQAEIEDDTALPTPKGPRLQSLADRNVGQ